MRALLVMASLMLLSSCLFSDTSAVIKLNSENFDRLVLESDEVWMVEFFGNAIITQPLGVDTVRDLQPISKKPLKSLKASLMLEPST